MQMFNLSGGLFRPIPWLLGQSPPPLCRQGATANRLTILAITYTAGKCLQHSSLRLT